MRKGGKLRFQKLLKTTRPCTAWEHAMHYVQPWPASRSSRQLFCWIGFGFFFSPFLISGSCGIFNRLQHFGVTFSWGGQLRCIITSCGKWWWCEGWEGGYWITKACFLFRKKWPCVRGPTSSCSVPRERAAPLHGVIGIRWTFACFHFYCFGDLLLLQSGSPVCCLFSVYMSEGSQRKHFNYILSRAKA